VKWALLEPNGQISFIEKKARTDEGRLVGALRVRAEDPDPYKREPPTCVAGESAAGESASGARMRER
jgi:hypothetical protein